MSNRVQQAYAVTVLAPIRNDGDVGVHHARELRAMLSQLGRGPSSPFADLGIVHTARLLVIDDLVSEALPGREDHLRSRYLLLVADVDGDLPTFVQALVRQHAAWADRVWGRCAGWPGTANVHDVIAYFRACAVNTALYFAGYPGATVDAALRALQQQREFIAFTEATRHLPSGELQAAFRAFRDRLEKAPSPTPGSL